jgi:amidase
MNRLILLLFLMVVISCKSPEGKTVSISTKDDTTSVKDFREFKVLDSKYINVSQLWGPFNKALDNFTEDKYNSLKSLVLEQDIPRLQTAIREGKLSYENLTKFYLYRIRKFDRENNLSLNSIITLNPTHFWNANFIER